VNQGPILVAPDSFKGTLSAAEVASAVAAGVEDAGVQAIPRPLADGGEGTLDVLADALGGDLILAPARGPLGDPLTGHVLLVDGGRTAVVETATASGLTLVPAERRDAWRASTAGTGDLLLAAARTGADEILLGVGGSATMDGGAGALDAIEAGGGLGGARLTVLCDVGCPFEHAASMFGPQKGADPATLVRLTKRLHRLADQLPRDPRGIDRTGAAGGLAGGLWAALGAQLVSGIDEILNLVGFDALLATATAVVTGEGRLDNQTAEGKVVSGVIRRARARRVAVHAVVGCTDLDADQSEELGLSGVLVAGDPEALRKAGRRIART